jgi:FkbM family methyltransferase
MDVLKHLAAALPGSWQYELKRVLYRRQIRHGDFVTTEPEFEILQSLVSAGDWVIDIGANVGHYAKRFSELVGPQGRVIALEPVSETFALLAANARLFRFANVTLFNVAASDGTELVKMVIPDFDTGLKNFYQAQITVDATGPQAMQVLTITLDSLAFPRRVALVKIDVEGHERSVLRGMERLLRRDHPTLIVETGSNEVLALLAGMGYRSEKLAKSPNVLFRHETVLAKGSSDAVTGSGQLRAGDIS